MFSRVISLLQLCLLACAVQANIRSVLRIEDEPQATNFNGMRSKFADEVDGSVGTKAAGSRRENSRLLKEHNEQMARSLPEELSFPAPARRGRSRKLREGRSLSSASTESPQFDFVVAGFPKCGTTTLLKAFERHEETAMASTEQCSMAHVKTDAEAMKKMDETLQTLALEGPVYDKKLSFKCPTAVYSHKSITRMQEHSPNAKFVIGVRHPIWMLQSYYNYRVTEIHTRELDELIPSIEEALARDEPWKGVSLDVIRYEVFLKQFAKTVMTPSDIGDLMGHPGYDIAVEPNNFEIFLYDMEQLEDDNEVRSASFREGLGSFLSLNEPLAPFERENTNHFVGDAGFDETIDICAPEHKDLRTHLVEQGALTAQWLISEFIPSKDVTVANKKHLIAALEKWGTDPCMSMSDVAVL